MVTLSATGRSVAERRVLGLGVAGAVALTAATGFAAGTAWTEHRHDLGGWQVEQAQVGQRVVSTKGEEWTYGASDSVPRWIDREGIWHESGWPECLETMGETTLRFLAHEVTTDDGAWRPIVAVDCREG